MTLRARIALFLAALCIIAVWNPPQPWGVTVGCGAYLLLLMPKHRKDGDA